MYKALAYKELRETGWIGGLMLAAMMLAVLDVMGLSINYSRFIFTSVYHNAPFAAHKIPFVHTGLLYNLSLVAIAGALGLGFFQALGESLRSTWLFLLFRPVPRTRAVLTKLLCGNCLLLMATAMPVLALALWAATPGTHASPFDWRMVAQPLRICFASTALYLGAFLSSLCEGRWYGSRLFPLGSGALAMAWVLITTWWPVTGWIVVFVVDAILLTAVLHLARHRDYP